VGSKNKFGALQWLGLEVDEFIRRNADPVWLHQNEMWELIEEEEYGSSGVAVGVLPAEEKKVTAAKTTAVRLQEPVECPF
jgi:hypothetical protein